VTPVRVTLVVAVDAATLARGCPPNPRAGSWFTHGSCRGNRR